MYCTQCNIKAKDTEKFCSHCGSRLVFQSGSAGQSKRCPECGKIYGIEDKFCEADGSQLELQRPSASSAPVLKFVLLILTLLLLAVLFGTGGYLYYGVDLKNGLIAYYKFDGSPKDSIGLSEDFYFNNVEFIDNSIYLNGIYDSLGSNNAGYTAKVIIKNIDYKKFTFSMDFNAIDFDNSYKYKNELHSILSFGPATRWFNIITYPKTGNLAIMLNNGRYVHEFKTTKVEPKIWNNIVCSVNFNERVIIVFFNKKKLPIVKLPDDLVIKTSDDIISFTNYGGGWAFHGYVDNLIFYDRSLSDIEIKQLIQLRKELL